MQRVAPLRVAFVDELRQMVEDKMKKERTLTEVAGRGGRQVEAQVGGEGREVV